MNTIIQTKETPEENTKKRKIIFGFLTLRLWCTSVLFPPFFCFWPFLQSLRLLLHFTKATSDTSKLSLIYLDGLWKKKYCITGCSFYNIPSEVIYQFFNKKVNCLIDAHWAFNKNLKSKVRSIQNFALIRTNKSPLLNSYSPNINIPKFISPNLPNYNILKLTQHMFNIPKLTSPCSPNCNIATEIINEIRAIR